MSLRQLCDVTYAILTGQVREEAMQNRLIVGFRGGKEPEPVGKAQDQLDEFLERPLNTERLRAAWLAEVNR